ASPARASPAFAPRPAPLRRGGAPAALGPAGARAPPSWTLPPLRPAGLRSRLLRSSAEFRPHALSLGRVDAHGHAEPPVRAHLLGEDLGVAMQPARAGTVGGVERELEHHAAGGHARQG